MARRPRTRARELSPVEMVEAELDERAWEAWDAAGPVGQTELVEAALASSEDDYALARVQVWLSPDLDLQAHVIYATFGSGLVSR